jgi:hypothetical protein
MSRVLFNMRIVHSTSPAPVTDNTKNLATPKVPRGLRGLPVTSGVHRSSGDMSDLQQDVAAIEQWWQDSRWKHTKRTYSGELLYHILVQFAGILSLTLRCLFCRLQPWMLRAFVLPTKLVVGPWRPRVPPFHRNSP